MPVAQKLAELLGAEVLLTDEPVGDGARKVVGDLKAGRIALLENLRFTPAEEANDDTFARGLASYAVRWHGDRPAVLWDAPAGARVTAPGLDPTWSTDSPKGDALLAPVAPPGTPVSLRRA